MNTPQQTIAHILREVAGLVEKMSVDELDAICSNTIQVTFLKKPAVAVSHAPDATAGRPSAPAEIQQLADQLRQSTDRTAAARILDEHCTSKDRLIQLARSLDLRAQKRDTVERLRMTIIEATIGFRLRSKAIQGSKAG